MRQCWFNYLINGTYNFASVTFLSSSPGKQPALPCSPERHIHDEETMKYLFESGADMTFSLMPNNSRKPSPWGG